MLIMWSTFQYYCKKINKSSRVIGVLTIHQMLEAELKPMIDTVVSIIDCLLVWNNYV